MNDRIGTTLFAIGGAAIGAALMYFFDPERGIDRRDRTRAQLVGAGEKVQEGWRSLSRATNQRAIGATEKALKWLHPKEAG